MWWTEADLDDVDHEVAAGTHLATTFGESRAAIRNKNIPGRSDLAAGFLENGSETVFQSQLIVAYIPLELPLRRRHLLKRYLVGFFFERGLRATDCTQRMGFDGARNGRLPGGTSTGCHDLVGTGSSIHCLCLW